MHAFSVKIKKSINQRTDVVGDSHHIDRSSITTVTKIEINTVVTMIIHRQATQIVSYYQI